MEIIESILTNSDCYRAAKPLSPSGIVIHSTGVDQKHIAAYTRQWDKPGVKACVHAFIGLDGEGQLRCVQTLPWDICCWGVGKGTKGSYNSSHLQVEICEKLDDGDWCRATYAMALELCRYWQAKFGIPTENVVCHSEAHALGHGSNHGDVMHWWPRHGLSMEKFREELSEEMTMSEENYQVFKAFMERWESERRALPPSDYALDACRKGIIAGIFADGNGDGLVDAPLAYVKRQELAAVLDRMGAFKP